MVTEKAKAKQAAVRSIMENLEKRQSRTDPNAVVAGIRKRPGQKEKR